VGNQFEIQVIDKLKKEIPDLQGIYLFGSYVDNSMMRESDIDIAFLTSAILTKVEKWRIQESLACVLDRNIDLVDINEASVILRTEIVEKGKRIYTANVLACESFEVITYLLYSDLNENRIDILNDYRNEYGRNSDK
jgi:predicted nucleotidyltransferase